MGEGKTEAENVRRIRNCLSGKRCDPPSEGSEKYQRQQGLRALANMKGGLPPMEVMTDDF